MREAIGRSWLLYLVISFLGVYVFFLSFVMNYASTYRAANYVVTQIETCQAQNNDCNNKTIGDIREEIRVLYHYIAPQNRSIDVCCIDNGNGSVYRVKLPVAFDVPILGTINWLNVKAETKTIQKVTCDSVAATFHRCS